jgi:hypothetical protein
MLTGNTALTFHEINALASGEGSPLDVSVVNLETGNEII